MTSCSFLAISSISYSSLPYCKKVSNSKASHYFLNFSNRPSESNNDPSLCFFNSPISPSRLEFYCLRMLMLCLVCFAILVTSVIYDYSSS